MYTYHPLGYTAYSIKFSPVCPYFGMVLPSPGALAASTDAHNRDADSIYSVCSVLRSGTLCEIARSLPPSPPPPQTLVEPNEGMVYVHI